MSNTLFADWAFPDGNKPPSLVDAKRAGLAGGIIRADFSTWKDPTLARDRDALRAAGLVYSAYTMPDYSATAPAPETQVDVAFEYAQLLPGVDLPMWLDIEFSRGIAATGRTRPQLADFIGRALTQIKKNQHGAAAGAYSSARVLQTDDTDTLADLADDVLDDCWAWYARYLLATRQRARIGDIDHIPDPPATKALGRCDFDQYQGDAIQFPGFSSTVDCDVYRPIVFGDVGKRVQRLQRRIGAQPDGKYGPLTDGLLKTFQAAHGLMPTGGVVDLQTWIKVAWTPAAT